MAKKHMKKYSPSPAIKEMQIKTTLRFYLTLVRIANITNQQQMLMRVRGKRNPHILLVGKQDSTTTLESNMEAS
jgi:hypothetical protein